MSRLLDLLRLGRAGDPVPCRLGLHDRAFGRGAAFSLDEDRFVERTGCHRQCRARGVTTRVWDRQPGGEFALTRYMGGPRD